MATHLTIVGRLAEGYIAYDNSLGVTRSYTAKELHDSLYNSATIITNAYWDTSIDQLRGFNIDLNKLPISDGLTIERKYHVFVEVDAEDKLFYSTEDANIVSMNKFCTYSSYYDSEYFSFLKDGNIYGGVGDSPEYYWIFKKAYSNVQCVVPYSDRFKSFFQESLYNVSKLQIPFGVYDLYDYLMVNGSCYLEVTIPKSVVYVDVDIFRWSPDMHKLVLPSSVMQISGNPSTWSNYNKNAFLVECKKDSYAYNWAIQAHCGIIINNSL